MRPLFSIRHQLSILVLGIMIPLLSLLAYTTYRQAQNDAVQTRNTALYLAHLTAADLEHFLQDANILLSTVVPQRPSEMTPTLCDPIDTYAGLLNPQIANIIILDRNGALICTLWDTPTLNPSEFHSSAWFQQARQHQQLVTSHPLNTVIPDTWISVLARPLRNSQGVWLGVVALLVDLNAYQRILNKVSLPQGATITVINQEGFVLARSLQPEQWVGHNASRTEIVDIVLANSTGYTQALGSDGIARIWGFTAIPLTQWHVYVGIPSDVALGVARAVALRNGVIVIAITVGVIALATLISRQIEQPLRSLAIATNAMSAGHWQVHVPISGPRELADVAQRFNEMLRSRATALAQQQASETRFTQIFHASPGAISLTALPTEHFVDINAQYLALTGYPREALIGTPVAALALWVDPTAYAAMIAEATTEGSVHAQEHQLRQKSGTIRTVSVSIEKIDLDGTPCLLSSLQDITARKAAEANVLHQAARAEALLRTVARLNEQPELAPVLQAICEESARALHLPAAAVQLYAPPQNTLTLAATWGLPDHYRQHYHPPHPPTQPLPPNTTALLSETAPHQYLPNLALYQSLDIRTLVTITLWRKDHLIGVLEVMSIGRPYEPTTDELALLQGLANQAAQAIDNARLFEEVRTGRLQQQLLSQRLIEAQESERRHLAHELHDEIGQVLTAVRLELGAIQRLTAEEEVKKHLDGSLEIVAQALQQVRTLSLNLRPAMLDDIGLVATLRWYSDQQARRAQLQISVHADLPPGRLPTAIETVCFRVAQEALTNTIKYAQAQHVFIHLAHTPDHLQVQIRDDGLGFDPNTARARAIQGGSLGILGMEERVRLAGGDFQLLSAPGQGTTIRLSFPLALPVPA